MSKEELIVAYEDAKTKTMRYKVNGVDITSSIEVLKEQFLNQWNNEHKITTELTFYERNTYAKQISDLEAKLAESERESNARYESWQEEIRECDRLRVVLAEVRKQLAESESRHLLDEMEWQDYCAFKHIEPQIKGCLDREREYEKQLAEKEERINWLVEAEFNRKWAKKYVEMRRKEDPMLCLPDSDEVYEKYFELKQQLETQENTITNLVEDNRASQEWYKKQLADTEAQNKRVLEKLELIVRSNQELEKENEVMAKTLKMTKFIEKEVNQDKISFAVEQLEKVKELILKECFEVSGSGVVVRYYAIYHIFDNQIKQLKEMK